MPVEPDISLGVKTPAPNASGNPLEMLGQLAQIRNALNQNQLFQQTFAARQKAGELLANSDPNDPMGGLKVAMADPDVAAFAPDRLQARLTAEQTLTHIQGEQQAQAQTGFAGFAKALPAVLSDPTQWPAVVNSQMALASPAARARMAPAIESIRQGLVDNLPSDPGAARTVFNNRLAGQLYAALGPAAVDVLSGTLGKPILPSTGGALQPALALPPQLGGGVQLAGPAIPLTLSPQTVNLPGGVPMPIVGAYGTNENAPNPSGGPAAQIQDVTSPLTPAPVGSPLYDPRRDGTSPSLGKAIGGLNVLSSSQTQANTVLQNEFNGPGLREFNNQNNALGMLQYMDNAYNTLVKGGGFQVPGTAANFRLQFSKAVNTLAQMTGSKPPFDATKTASAEDFIKQTNLLGTGILTTMLGNQREAAQTISKFMQSVPGIENTYMGGKLLIDTYRGALQRGIDYRNFLNTWQSNPANQGSLVGASEAFNKAYPAEKYADQILAKHGMTEHGFTSPETIRNAVREGYLTPDEAKSIAIKQFGAQPAGAASSTSAPPPLQNSAGIE